MATLGSKLRKANATWILAGMCVAAFVCLDVEALWLPSSADALVGEPWRLLTALFGHGHPLHLLANVVALLALCPFAESRLGSWRTAALFLAAGIAGNLAFALTGALSAAHSSLVGCSASVLGVAAWLIGRRYPRMLALGAAVAATGVVGPNPGGAMAHLAGLAVGYAWLRLAPKAKTAATDDSLIEKARQSGFASLTEAERSSLFSQSRTAR